MGFNLDEIEQVQSAEVEIKDDEGNGTGVYFLLAGPTHPDRKRIQFAASRKAAQRYQKTGKVELLDPEESEQLSREHLAKFTLGWRGYVDASGQEVPFSQKKALEIYQDEKKLWLVDQLEAALQQKERFMKRSATA